MRKKRITGKPLFEIEKAITMQKVVSLVNNPLLSVLFPTTSLRLSLVSFAGGKSGWCQSEKSKDHRPQALNAMNGSLNRQLHEIDMTFVLFFPNQVYSAISGVTSGRLQMNEKNVPDLKT